MHNHAGAMLACDFFVTITAGNGPDRVEDFGALPQANAYCERLIGTIRRECLDWLIVLNERHLRSFLKE